MVPEVLNTFGIHLHNFQYCLFIHLVGRIRYYKIPVKSRQKFRNPGPGRKGGPGRSLTVTLHLYANCQRFNYKALSRAPTTEKRKEIQNCSCADACSFGGTIFGYWWIDSAPKENAVCTAAILDFFLHVRY